MTTEELDYPSIPRELLSRILEFLAGMGAAMTLYYLERPEEWRMTVMRTALWGKRYSQRRADRWQRWADMCATFYNRQKV